MNDIKKQFLSIGEVIIKSSPTEIWTILGSCISVVIYCKRLKIGAMCHARLPEKRNAKMLCRANCPNPCHTVFDKGEDNQYVTCAINYMVNKLTSMGVKKHELNTAIIGGSNMFKLTKKGGTVGEQNSAIAIKMAKDNALNIIHIDVGGTTGRKVLFNTNTGEIKSTLQITNNK